MSLLIDIQKPRMNALIFVYIHALIDSPKADFTTGDRFLLWHFNSFSDREIWELLFYEDHLEEQG